MEGEHQSPTSAGSDAAGALRSAAPLRPAPPPSIWHRPVSYRVQCWVAWAGLTAFGIRGLLAMRNGAAPDVERLTAAVLSVAWGIDLLRGRSAER